MTENKGFHIEATEIIEDGDVTCYRVTVPENPDSEAFCERTEEIIPTGCKLREGM